MPPSLLPEVLLPGGLLSFWKATEGASDNPLFSIASDLSEASQSFVIWVDRFTSPEPLWQPPSPHPPAPSKTGKGCASDETLKNFLIPTRSDSCCPGSKISPFQTMNHTLPKFFLGSLSRVLPDALPRPAPPAYFPENNPKTYGIFVEIMNKAFCSCKMPKFPHLIFLNFFRHIFDPGCFFRLNSSLSFFCQSFRFFLYGFQPCSDRLLIQNHFRSPDTNNICSRFSMERWLSTSKLRIAWITSPPQLDSPGIFLR